MQVARLVQSEGTRSAWGKLRQMVHASELEQRLSKDEILTLYLTLAPCPTLDGKHTIFGRVVVGMETVKRLGAVVTDANDRPTEDVVLLDARLG